MYSYSSTISSSISLVNTLDFLLITLFFVIVLTTEVLSIVYSTLRYKTRVTSLSSNNIVSAKLLVSIPT